MSPSITPRPRPVVTSASCGNPAMQLPPPNPPRIESCPATGDGVHTWLLSQANRCRIGGLSETTTELILQEGSQSCGRKVPDGEITAAVKKAFESDWTPPARPQTSHRPKPARKNDWPDVDRDQVNAIVSTGYGLADLWEASEIRLDDDSNHADEVVGTLFPGDPLICVAPAFAGQALTKSKSEWQGSLASCALIVPSPMSAPTGINQDGNVSTRCLDNTGPRRFIVVEFDSGTSDAQAALLLHLGQFAPLVLALHSGSESLHGWFYVEGQAEQEVRRFFSYAVSLGADKSAWPPCQMMRMPDGLRDNGNRQTVFLFNPRSFPAHA